MKKLFALVLALTLVLSLAACGGNAAPAGNINDIAKNLVLSLADYFEIPFMQ